MLFPKTEKTEVLLKKSDLILNVFRDTAEQLASVNDEIEQEHLVLESQRAEIEAKQNSLIEQRAQNEKVVTKIKQFLED